VPTATITDTATPTLTPPETQPPTLTPTGPIVAVCGDGIVTSPEQCDDGGSCVGGANNGMKCPATIEGGVGCGAEGLCTPFGGDGCANNCTTETQRMFTFSGATCSGGPNNGQPCDSTGTNPFCGDTASCLGVGSCIGISSAAFQSRNGMACAVSTQSSGAICQGGTAKGKACPNVAACRTCQGGANHGQVCTSATNCPGGTCPSLVCTAGANVGKACTSNSNCPGGTCTTILTCNTPDAAKQGIACTGNADCGTGGVCTAICSDPCDPSSPVGECLSDSRALLTSASLTIAIGPIIGGQTINTGQPSADGRIPVAVNASNVVFKPIKVSGLVCACVRGIPDPPTHGPGNSASGYIYCGTTAEQLPGIDITLAVDHNTTPPRICTVGKQGEACATDGDCTLPGTCDGTMCVTGPNIGTPCSDDGSCIVFGTCNQQGPGTCAGDSGPKTGNLCVNNTQCLTAGTCAPAGTTPRVCLTGKVGQACTSNAACSFAGECQGVFQGGGICVGGTRNRQRCTTANTSDTANGCPGGVCTSPDDPTCTAQDPLPERASRTACTEKNEICTTGSGDKFGQPCTFATAPTDCNGGSCGTTCNATSPHAGVCNSPVHVIQSGTGVQGQALLLNTTAIGTILDGGSCAEVGVGDPNRPQGADGKPCTDDDPPASRGSAQTLPTTTGSAAAVLVDINAFTGSVLANGQCSGASTGNCQSSISGGPYSCAALMANPTGGTSGVRTATAFPALETATVGDDTVITIFTAR
jgi:hypothetical protein